ncbi:hypothetical protein E0W68_04375 [Flavobacterium salilacus subsp. salilacus]|uniref:hypothetical protein n=1 Tax=Flavobacterium TaxID=237 RepID=UPI001074C1D6|nr:MULTISPECIES: hypothetical protein [Flavobacterium]KAF2519586.1 hypothetical protein E0W68_04375 [Flavobacterium salilacus subsp. salilacus]MBE1614512.1 hypothetical protein [Flavobacterium sp. SaA2.13]
MKFIEILQYLPKFYPIFLTTGLIIGIVSYRYIDRLHKTIFFYLLAMLIVDIVSRLLKYFYFNNQIMLLVYSLIELFVFVLLYRNYLFSKKNKILIFTGYLGTIYIIGEIVYYFIINDTKPEQFQPYAKVVDNFIIILLALTFLYEKMNSFKESRWDNFRLNIVVLVFFTLNTLIFLPFNFLVNEASGIKFYFWACNLILVVIFYGFLISEIWRNGRIRK